MATKTEQAKAKYSGESLQLPTNATTMERLMAENQDVYGTPTLPDDFDRYFEIGLQYWLMDSFNLFTLARTQDFKTFSPLVGSSFYKYNYPVLVIPGGVVRYGTKLRYAAISVNTTLLVRNLAFGTGLPIRDYWEEFLTEQMSKMPTALQNGFMTTTKSRISLTHWHWLQVQKVLVKSAINGVIIGVCVAFPILLLATGNILVALYATLVICMTTVSVMGTLPLNGYQLGMPESLNLVMVVGLAVDYVVHLAEGYCRSQKTDRAGRVHDMLQEVGVSVLSGAITTLGSSLFLFLAVITFFKQFGGFMFATIGFSIFYSLVLFVAAMTVIGPEGDCGSLKPLWAKLCARITKRRDATKEEALANGDTSQEQAANRERLLKV